MTMVCNTLISNYILCRKSAQYTLPRRTTELPWLADIDTCATKGRMGVNMGLTSLPETVAGLVKQVGTCWLAVCTRTHRYSSLVSCDVRVQMQQRLGAT